MLSENKNPKNEITTGHKVIPFLWFDNNAKEAMDFYSTIFKNSKITEHGTFEIDGREFYFFNGGPMFKFNEAISLFVNCDTQQEIDALWEALSEGGEKSRCGWLKDKFGLSWQVVPRILGKLLNDSNRVKSKSVMDAMLKMNKLEIDKLQEAYDQA